MLQLYILDINLRRNGKHMAEEQIIPISKFNKLKKSTSKKVTISVQNVTVSYDGKIAVDNISMNINQNEVTALIGPSGCGKSTFIRCLNRMNDVIDNCTIEGKIILNGINIYNPEVDIVKLRTNIGMVFQKPNPFPKSIYDNVTVSYTLLRAHETREEIV